MAKTQVARGLHGILDEYEDIDAVLQEFAEQDAAVCHDDDDDNDDRPQPSPEDSDDEEEVEREVYHHVNDKDGRRLV